MMEEKIEYATQKHPRTLLAELRSLLDQAEQQPLLAEARELSHDLQALWGDLGEWRAGLSHAKPLLAEAQANLKLAELEALEATIASGELGGKNAEERTRKEFLYLASNESFATSRAEIKRLEAVVRDTEHQYASCTDRLAILRKRADLVAAQLMYLSGR